MRVVQVPGRAARVLQARKLFPDGEEAISRIRRALDEFVVEGIKTTIPFHKYVIMTPEFLSGNFDTHFIEENISQRTY